MLFWPPACKNSNVRLTLASKAFEIQTSVVKKLPDKPELRAAVGKSQILSSSTMLPTGIAEAALEAGLS